MSLRDLLAIIALCFICSGPIILSIGVTGYISQNQWDTETPKHILMIAGGGVLSYLLSVLCFCIWRLMRSEV